MLRRSLRSINNLSSRFRRSDSPKNDAGNNHLIWILLAPAKDATSYQDFLRRLGEALSAHDGVQSMRRLRAIVPYCGVTPTNLTSATCANAVLVSIETPDIEVSVEDITELLKSSDYTGEGDHRERLVHWRLSSHSLAQVFEPKRSKGVIGSCLVTVLIYLSKAQASDVEQSADIEAWYRKEQLPLLGKHSPHLFLSSRRYTGRRRSSARRGTDSQGEAAAMLAVHEYVSVDALLRYSLDHGQVVEETEWSRRVLGRAEKVERAVWEVVA